jgi:hypothetical protein
LSDHSNDRRTVRRQEIAFHSAVVVETRRSPVAAVWPWRRWPKRMRTGLSKGSDETAPHRDCGSLGPGVDAELGEEIGDVGLYGARADVKCFTDILVGVPLGQQA